MEKRSQQSYVEFFISYFFNSKTKFLGVFTLEKKKSLKKERGMIFFGKKYGSFWRERESVCMFVEMSFVCNPEFEYTRKERINFIFILIFIFN